MRIKRLVCFYVYFIIIYFYLIEKRIYFKYIKSVFVVIVDLKISNIISLFVLLKKKCICYLGIWMFLSLILF